MTDGELILAGGALLSVGLAASLLASSFRVPALVLVLGAGMLIGSDGTGWIDFADYELARTIGVIALALILFEGGLASGWGEIGPVLRPAVLLAFIGTIGTAVMTGLVAAWLFDFSTLEGLLLGSVLAATDAAAVFSILRTSTLRRRLARTLEGESGMNDPVAVLLVLGFIQWIENPGFGLADMAWLFVEDLTIGLAVGLAVGFAGAALLRRSHLASGGLYPVGTLAIAAVAFGGSEVLDGSGFLAVYLAGLVLGSVQLPARRTVAGFHEGLSWVAQLAMFFTLGLLVFPSDLGNVAFEATILAIVAVAIARPLAAFAATAFERFTRRRAPDPGLGRDAWSGPDGARHLSRDRGGAGQHRVLQHRVLRGGAVDARAGGDDRAARAHGLRMTTVDARRCRGRWASRRPSRRWAPRSSSTRSCGETRSSGCTCATSGCRATRS